MARSCSDGFRNPFEACDDGNLIEGDGCSKVCHVEYGYECDHDPSNVNLPDVCTKKCGNGLLNASDNAEQCDDGNKINSDGCSSSCLIETGW